MIAIDILGWPYYNPYEYISLEGTIIMLAALCFILILSWFVRRGQISFKLSEEPNLGNYIFNFNQLEDDSNNEIHSKKISLITKIVLFVFVGLLMFNPLYKLLNPLN
ncbi:hypothetical protein N1F78_09450 [Seonamhaeicola sp. MEBiC1930]|uniref:hypothetical protein n=1 Tax=Seonamhaeicola sp. MEBiC01930 TaxID=2976768 RepID=UPI00325483E6